MKFAKTRRTAISSNLLTGTIVGGFVGLVVIALIWASVAPGSPRSNQLAYEEIALFGGPPSTHSLNSTCQGDAQFEVFIQNPTADNITVENVAISGSGVKNASVFVALSNACLTIAESSPVVPSNGDYQLEGYASVPLRYTSTYDCFIEFSNGQILNETLIAQS
jgi:hypothetical protein